MNPPPQQFEEMASAVMELQKDLDQLTVLENTVKSNQDVFFNSEIEKVGQAVKEKAHQCAILQHELATRVHVYENDVTTLSQALCKRQALMDAIEKETGVLQRNNLLLNAFANGQVAIQNDLTRLKKRAGVDA